MSLAVLGLAARWRKPALTSPRPLPSPTPISSTPSRRTSGGLSYAAFHGRISRFRAEKTTYALFGWPLGHTMSRAHAQLFQKPSGRDAAHRRCSAGEVAGSVRAGQAQARRHQLHDSHKKAVIPLLDDIDTAASDLHSVNTVRFADGKATGFNTDILGFAESLNRDGVSLQGKKVLLLGYGGAASVMAYHCVTGRVPDHHGTQSREGRSAAEAADRCRSGRTHFRVQSPAHSARYSYRAQKFQFPPVGMYPKENAAPLHYLPHKTGNVRCDYNPPVTSTMKLANPRKTKTRDGLFMLVMQAAHARWTGIDGSRRREKPFCAAPTAKWRSSVAREAWQKKSGAVRLYGQRQDLHRP